MQMIKWQTELNKLFAHIISFTYDLFYTQPTNI